MKYTDFYAKFKGTYTKQKFTNEQGEEFIVIRTTTIPQMYLITGKEFDWGVRRLFNSEFDVWSAGEMAGLAKALGKLL